MGRLEEKSSRPPRVGEGKIAKMWVVLKGRGCVSHVEWAPRPGYSFRPLYFYLFTSSCYIKN